MLIRQLLTALLSLALAPACFGQGVKIIKIKKIPVVKGYIESKATSTAIHVKEPEVRFWTDSAKVFAVTTGTVTFASNLNVIVDTDSLIYTYLDVKGLTNLEGKKVKRGQQIGTMYYNDDRKKYGFSLTLRTKRKRFLTSEEIIELTSKG
jgi:hypothetical protein